MPFSPKITFSFRLFWSTKFAVNLRSVTEGLEQSLAKIKVDPNTADGFILSKNFDDPAAARAVLVDRYQDEFALVGVTMPDASVFAQHDAALKAIVDDDFNDRSFQAPQAVSKENGEVVVTLWEQLRGRGRATGTTTYFLREYRFGPDGDFAEVQLERFSLGRSDP